MKFLRKQLRPWSIPWIFQRFIAVMKEGRLPQIRIGDLLYDLKLTRKINTGIKNASEKYFTVDENNGDDVFNFVPSFDYETLFTLENADPGGLSGLNQYFDHIYVINLGKRLDRRVEIIQKLNTYSIQAEIIEAINGYTPENQKEFYEFYQKSLASEGTHPLERTLMKKMINSPGGWGYLKTYHRLLHDAREKNYKRILCLDDDILIHVDFEEAFRKAKMSIPGDWKLFYLGASQHEWRVPYNISYPLDLPERDFVSHPFYHPVRTDGSFAVGIDHTVYDEIITEIEKMNCSLDSGPLRHIQQKYPGQCFVLNPNLIVADVSQSDIAVDRDQFHMAKKLRWDMSLYDYPFRKELVSVIMPAFNAEKTIEKSIRSLLIQTYREFEIIVGDDGSSDATPEIVSRLAREDSRVKLFRLEKNQGCYWARNAALRASQGKYIAIQDSDDVSLSTRIETQIIPLLTGRSLFTLSRIFRSRCSVDDLDIHDQREMARLVMSLRTPSVAGLYEYRDKPIIGFMTSMFTRSLFEELGLFWENRFGSDAEFLERVLYHKAGILLTEKDGTIHSWLMDRKSVPGIYERIDKVQLISADMTGDNITNRTSQQQKEEFEETWRKRLRGEINYEYPKF